MLHCPRLRLRVRDHFVPAAQPDRLVVGMADVPLHIHVRVANHLAPAMAVALRRGELPVRLTTQPVRISFRNHHLLAPDAKEKLARVRLAGPALNWLIAQDDRLGDLQARTGNEEPLTLTNE